jgi:hypothetical protein
VPDRGSVQTRAHPPRPADRPLTRRRTRPRLRSFPAGWSRCPGNGSRAERYALSGSRDWFRSDLGSERVLHELPGLRHRVAVRRLARRVRKPDHAARWYSWMSPPRRSWRRTMGALDVCSTVTLSPRGAQKRCRARNPPILQERSCSSVSRAEIALAATRSNSLPVDFGRGYFPRAVFFFGFGLLVLPDLPGGGSFFGRFGDTGSLLPWLAVLCWSRVRIRSEAPSRPAERSARR